jgi:flagella basal body P-ring formation protein FlgA
MVCGGESMRRLAHRAVIGPMLALTGVLSSVDGIAASAGQPPAAEPEDAAAISIEMRPDASVRGSQVRLGDVAFMTTRDLTLLRQMMALPLGHAPRPGSPAVLDRETVVRWVTARSMGTKIAWRGAAETFVESASQQISGETVANAARDALRRWLAQRSARAEVEPVSSGGDLTLPAGEIVLRVRPLPSQAMPSRRMVVWVDVWVDDRFVRTSAVRFEVQAWAPLRVAAMNVDRDTVMDPVVAKGAFRTREVDVTTLRSGSPVEPDGAQANMHDAQRVRRPLHEGEVLTRSHLQAAPAVARGGSADLTAKSGVVTIESRVEVLQDGKIGDVVRVKIPGAGGEVLALVTAPGRVEVRQ